MGSLDETLGTDPGATAASLAEGSSLGAYRIERLLGEGAMGEVYLATHMALGRPVALKTLKAGVSNRALLERFFAEARAVNLIRHENIVECTDLQADARPPFIVMELLEGKTLGQAIEEGGRIPVRRAARIAAQIADAIGAAHAKTIVHRDLKPDNVFLIRRAGTSDYVKVLDFGIARLRPDLGVSATASGLLIGTPAYMSPEQVRGEKVGPGADIYALGAIVFHMLTGRLPFNVSSMSMMLVAQLQETAPRVDELVPDVPPGLADFVAHTLAKDAKHRPPDMATFRRDMLALAGLPTDPGTSLAESSAALTPAVYMSTMPPMPISSSSVGSSPGQSSISASTGQMMPVPSKRRSWLIGMVAGAVVAGGVAVAVGLSSSSSKSGETKSAETKAPEAAQPPPAAPQPAVVAVVEPLKPTPPPPQPTPAVTPPPPQPEPIATAVAEPPKPEPPKPDAHKIAKKKIEKKATVAPPPPPRVEKKVEKKIEQVVTAPPPPPPPPPDVDCSLDGFVRVYESCSDKAAASVALRRLNQCRNASKLSSKVDYDVVKRALVRCL